MSFKEIFGHKKIINNLQKSLAANNIAQAYIFYGPKGVGKKLTAINFAKALNCKNKINDSCDSCDSCKKINTEKVEESVHPDFIFIYPKAKNIEIEYIREKILPKFYLKNLEGKYKICIFDEAEKLSLAIFNTLLKTLEEPPENTIIILICETISNIPLTVLSRCQMLSFTPLTTKEILILPQIQKFNEEEKNFLAFLSRGIPAIIVKQDSELKIKFNNFSNFFFSLINSNDEIYALKLSENLLNSIKPQKEELESNDEDNEDKEKKEKFLLRRNLDEFFEYLLFFFRDLLLKSINCENQNIIFTKEITNFYYDANLLVYLFWETVKLKEEIKKNVNLELALQLFFKKIIAAKKDTIYGRNKNIFS